MVWRYTLLWLPLCVAAFINGTVRAVGYGKLMSELRAHQLSTFTGIVLTGILIWLFARRWRMESAGQAVVIGLIWLAFTVAFEFVLGHFVLGHPWSRLLADYNLLAGRLWLLFLVWIAIAPLVFYRLNAR